MLKPKSEVKYRVFERSGLTDEQSLSAPCSKGRLRPYYEQRRRSRFARSLSQ